MGDYQLLPDLSADEFERLKADIAARGVLVPIEKDEEGNVLDGHHRLRACHELGISDYLTIVRTGLSEADKRTHVRMLNLARRHLNQEQRRKLIEEELQESPEKSNAQIAETLGVSDKTVAAVRENHTPELSGSEIPNPITVTGKDGKFYPRKKTMRIEAKGINNEDAVLESARRIKAHLPVIPHHRTTFTGENEWYTPTEYVERAIATAIDQGRANGELARLGTNQSDGLGVRTADTRPATLPEIGVSRQRVAEWDRYVCTALGTQLGSLDFFVESMPCRGEAWAWDGETLPDEDEDGEEPVVNRPQVEPGAKSRDVAAKAAGFSSTTEYRRAKAVVERGTPELVALVEEGKLAVSAAELDRNLVVVDHRRADPPPCRRPYSCSPSWCSACCSQGSVTSSGRTVSTPCRCHACRRSSASSTSLVGERWRQTRIIRPPRPATIAAIRHRTRRPVLAGVPGRPHRRCRPGGRAARRRCRRGCAAGRSRQ